MRSFILFSFALTVRAQSQWQYSWPSPGQLPLFGEQDPIPKEQCTQSNLTSFEMVQGRKPVTFTVSPLEHLETPKITPLNASAGEQWEFDGVSEDAMASFVIGFYRDPNYAILGSGNFRLSVEFAFKDRPRFYEVYYPSRSVVETCPSGTRGIWADEKEGYSFEFQVSADMSEAVVVMNSKSVRGSVVIRSLSKPLLADGHMWPKENASTAGAPFFHWAEPIPAGTVEVDLTAKGDHVTWQGMGGHERFWSAFSWFTCLTHLNAVRTMLGPYVLTYFAYTSNMNKGVTTQSTVLFKDGIPVFRSTLGEPSPTDDYAVVTKSYNGAVTGTLKDKVTGYQLELVSPGSKQHYTFFIEHKNLGFEYILGEGVGGSGFSGMSRGGHVGLAQHEGVSLTEALTFPKNSPLFRSNYVE